MTLAGFTVHSPMHDFGTIIKNILLTIIKTIQPNANMKKALFFDMYQTLVDTQIGDKKEAAENAYKEVFCNFLIKNNIRTEKADAFQSNYKKLQDEFYSEHDKEFEHHDFKKLLAQTFEKFYGINIEEIVLIELIWQYRILTRGNTKLYPGVKETLEKLSKEYRIFLASYTQSSYSKLELEELGVKSYFTDFIFSSDIGYKKMSDNFYKKCVETSGREANDCIMIGDNNLEDMYMANKNGMKTIWVKNPITIKEEGICGARHDKELDIKDFGKIVDLVQII